MVVKKLTCRFKHIVLLYDMDKTGQDSSRKQQAALNVFGVQRMLLPLAGTKESKDISDYFKLGYSEKDFRDLFISLLDRLYSETLSMLKSCEVNFKTPPPFANITLSVNGVPLGTQGNLTCITGGEGTGKSNYVGALIAGAIRNENSQNIDTLGINVFFNESNKAVLLYDTEQSEAQLHKNSSNILIRAGCSNAPKHFKAYCLTAMSRKERLQSIIQSMDKFHHLYGGIAMVVIDGIADLVRCANDESESVYVVEELYRLAGIYNTSIICVLHFVPNGVKLRGHLGSELQRKAATILSIEKDSNPAISVVKALKIRDGNPLDVPLMKFNWSKEKGMHVYSGEKTREDNDRRKIADLTLVARDIFKQSSKFSYKDLTSELVISWMLKNVQLKVI